MREDGFTKVMKRHVWSEIDKGEGRVSHVFADVSDRRVIRLMNIFKGLYRRESVMVSLSSKHAPESNLVKIMGEYAPQLHSALVVAAMVEFLNRDFGRASRLPGLRS